MRPLDTAAFDGAHPTARDFYEQLLAWGFTRCRQDEGVHLVMRGPHGGRLRLLRSLTGRVDAGLVEKAARLADTSLEQFWAGPPVADEPESRTSPEREAAAPDEARDSFTSLVLAAHVKVGRPMGFEEVVDLCDGRATRDQVRTASAALCRDGHLQRVGAGVYQWTNAAVARRSTDAGPAPLQADQESTAPTAAGQPADVVPAETVELFRQLFPRGVNLTAETFADFQRWAELTQRLGDKQRAS